MVCANLLPLFAHIHSTFIVTIGAIQGIRGCYRTSSVIKASITFILLSAFQLGWSPETNRNRKHASWLVFSPGLISLTLIRAVQSWRVVNGPLYDVLVKHNIFYYTFALRKLGHTCFCARLMMILVPIVLSALNVLTQTLFSKVRRIQVPFNIIELSMFCTPRLHTALSVKCMYLLILLANS
jgi:hypothetical protein